MRPFLLLVAFGCIACGGADPEMFDAGLEGGTDAKPDTGKAETGPDANGMDFPTSPGDLKCGNLTCLSMSFACCYTKNGTMIMTSCADPGACPLGPMSVEIGCEETGDCAQGEICCRNGMTTSCVKGTCAGTQRCAKNAECMPGQCKAYTCPIEGVIHACAQPSDCK